MLILHRTLIPIQVLPNNRNDVVKWPRQGGIAFKQLLCVERRRGRRVQYDHAYNFWPRRQIAILQEQGKSKLCHVSPRAMKVRGSSQHHELTTFPGLHPSYSLSERQYTGLHCPPSTETPTRFSTYLLVLHIRTLESRCFLTPCMAPRTLPRRCPRYICQSRPRRRRFAPKAILPRTTTSYNNTL